MKNLVTFKKYLKSIVVISSVLAASHVLAGAKVTQTVSASPTFILGNVGDARNSANTIEYISIEDYGTSVSVIAVAASGSMASCYTNNSAVMAQLRSASSDSQIRVNISSGVCSTVFVMKSSKSAPKV